MNDQPPANKQQLIAYLNASAQALQDLLAQIPAWQFSTTEAVESWTVKDTLAHINYWLEFINSQIIAAIQHRDVPQVDDVAEQNRLIIVHSQSQTWAQVHARFGDCLNELISTIQDLSDEDLFTPGRFPQIGPEPLWQPIAWEGYEHINEHGAQLNTWWHLPDRSVD